MTTEQEARDMLERMDIANAQNMTAGDLVELANLIAENKRLKDRMFPSGADYSSEQIIIKDLESGTYSFKNGRLEKVK